MSDIDCWEIVPSPSRWTHKKMYEYWDLDNKLYNEYLKQLGEYMAKTHAAMCKEFNETLDKILKLRKQAVKGHKQDIDWDIVSADIDCCAALGADLVTFLLQHNLRLSQFVTAAVKQSISAPKKPSDVLKRAHAKPVTKKKKIVARKR